MQLDEPLDDEALRVCRIAATAAVAVRDEGWKAAVVELLAERDQQWREAIEPYRAKATDAESARAAQLALGVLESALPGVVETIERSTRLSVVEREPDGFIERVTTSTVDEFVAVTQGRLVADPTVTCRPLVSPPLHSRDPKV